LDSAITGHGVVATKSEVKLDLNCHIRASCIDTLGAFGEAAQSFIHELCRRITEVTGERRPTEFLWQRLSVAIQRGNASCVLGTVDCTDYYNLDTVYYCNLF
jgi:hypothetical protein